MSVKAKFRCDTVTPYYEGMADEGRTVNFSAVIGTEGDNKDWSKWTPFGQLQMNISNPDAFEQFKQGGIYYLILEPVDATAAQ